MSLSRRPVLVDEDYANDIATVGRISAIPAILAVVCQATGMGFASVARVTDHRWIACSTRDAINLGLRAGSELPIETTICNEIREHRRAVVIENVDEDPFYRDHPTPKLYGLQSYISTPIMLSDGRFFGTLCAVDPRPAPVGEPHILGMFRLFAEMIGQSYEALRAADASQQALVEEQRNFELRTRFVAALGSDLRNPVTGIQAGVQLLGKEGLGDRAAMILDLIGDAADRTASIIDDLSDLAAGKGARRPH